MTRVIIYRPDVYHAAVRRNVRRTYATLSRGDYAKVVRSFDPAAVLVFPGEHALGGTRRGRESIGSWFGRLFRFFPDLALNAETILVQGFPWDTRVGICFRATATLPTGTAYSNAGMQYLRLRWGRIVEDRLYEDTQAIAAALHELSEAGISEARL